MHRPVSVLGRLHVVGNHQDGLAEPRIEIPQKREHRQGIGRIEIARRLICQQDRRPGRQSPGNRDTLLLAP